MRPAILFPVIFLVFQVPVFAQTYSGIILDDETLNPIAYANIGIQDTRRGTYSEGDGTFTITLKKEDKSSILLVSAMGYEPVILDLSDYVPEQSIEVSLVKANYELGSFTVKDSRLKTKTVGNRRLPVMHMAYTGDIWGSRIGRTIAVKIRLRQDVPIYINEVSIGVYENPWKEAQFRLRIMSIDSAGLPGKDLLQLHELSTMTEEKGWVHFKFEEKFPVLMANTFFLVVENINDEGVWRNPDEAHGIFPIYMFNAATLSKQPVYLSNEGMHEWEKKSKDPTFRLRYAYE